MCFSIVDQCDHAPQCIELSLDVSRPTHGSANIELSNQLARWACETAQRFKDGHQRRCKSGALETSCNQTHGLMADRSRGNEQDGFDVIGLQSFDQIGNQLAE